MIERRHPSELYAIELEKARSELNSLLKNQSAPASEIKRVALRARELEVRLATVKLAQSERANRDRAARQRASNRS